MHRRLWVGVFATVLLVLPRYRAAASVMLRSAETYQPGTHGLSEVLYNFASTANNNGSAFAFQGTGTQWYTTTQGISMLIFKQKTSPREALGMALIVIGVVVLIWAHPS